MALLEACNTRISQSLAVLAGWETGRLARELLAQKVKGVSRANPGPIGSLLNLLKNINPGDLDPYRSVINTPYRPPLLLSTGMWVQQHEPFFCAQAWGFSNMPFSMPKMYPKCPQGVPGPPTSTIRRRKVSPKTPQSRLKAVKSAPRVSKSDPLTRRIIGDYCIFAQTYSFVLSHPTKSLTGLADSFHCSYTKLLFSFIQLYRCTYIYIYT